MRTAMLLCALLLSGCASVSSTFKNWSATEKLLYDIGDACITIDYLQTESALDSGNYSEGNPFWGSDPSDDKLFYIHGARKGAHYLFARTLKPEQRMLGSGIMALVNCAPAIHNHSIGVRISL